MTKLYDRREVCQTYFFPQPHEPLPSVDHAGPLDLHLPGGTRIGGYWSRPLARAPSILYLHVATESASPTSLATGPNGRGGPARWAVPVYLAKATESSGRLTQMLDHLRTSHARNLI